VEKIDGRREHTFLFAATLLSAWNLIAPIEYGTIFHFRAAIDGLETLR
jgi:hypothetical protein